MCLCLGLQGCGCSLCEDRRGPTTLTVTGAAYVDRTYDLAGPYLGYVISPLSILNRAHVLDRVHVGGLLQFLDPEDDARVGDVGNPCLIVYEKEFAFGDLYLGTFIDATAWADEANWARGLSYRMRVALRRIDGEPDYLGGFDLGGPIGSSVVPPSPFGPLGAVLLGAQLAGTAINRATFCGETPAAEAFGSPASLPQYLKVYDPASPATWFNASTSTTTGIPAIPYGATAGDAISSEQSAGTVELIASGGRS